MSAGPLRARGRVCRLLLVAIAGSGLTATTLGGPLASSALGATRAASTHSHTVPLSVTEAGSGSPEPGSTTPSPSPQPGAGQTTSTTTSTTTAPPTETSTRPLVVTPAPESRPSTASRAPAVAVQRRQKTTPTNPESSQSSASKPAAGAGKAAAGLRSANVAPAPQLVAAQAGILAAELAGSAASVQALSFYRIPLFLLPIYQAAAAQYGVPWQILAAINEIETDYGNDLSVSTAGAVGWMQFMPATWIQYGVDALNAGYADPYNPVDAIFAAARYLRAAGASSNLRAAILAYNHSAEYVSSVLLRAKLISSYPNPVIAALTGLTDGRLPVRNGQVAWNSIARMISPSGATAHAASVPAAGEAAAPGAPASAPAPSATAPVRTGKVAVRPLQLIDLTTSANATVVAVQDGSIVRLGSSRALGRYVVLRDVYGDMFTYAGLGSIASSFRKPKPPRPAGVSAAALAAKQALKQGRRPGHGLPITLHVNSRSSNASAPASSPRPASSSPPPAGKVRLFAHPGNPDALAAGANSAASDSLPLRAGATVAKGTVLGHARTPPGAKAGHLRFAIRPAGDLSSIDPRPILQNWSQLRAALHPQGVRGETDLLGATASGVFLLPKSDLQRDVLSDPGVSIAPCGRQAIAAGAIDRRVLALLAFLSRSGLKPTVGALRCEHLGYTTASGLPSARVSSVAVDISAIDSIPIAGHQGPGTISDVAIRTLLTMRGEFVPEHIISLMQYPGAANTLAQPGRWDRIHIAFRPLPAAEQPSPAAAAAIAHSARKGKPAPPPLLVGTDLSGTQWDQFFTRVSALHAPSVPVKRSSAAIPDHLPAGPLAPPAIAGH